MGNPEIMAVQNIGFTMPAVMARGVPVGKHFHAVRGVGVAGQGTQRVMEPLVGRMWAKSHHGRDQ